MDIATGEIVHHLYSRPGDLLPYCCVIPGPDEITGRWNTGHGLDDLLRCLSFGLAVCVVCVSQEALDGFTPIIFGEEK